MGGPLLVSRVRDNENIIPSWQLKINWKEENKLNKKVVVVIAVVAVVLCLVLVGIGAVIGFGVLGATQPAADTGEKFMQALKAGDYAAANALCLPALQQKVGNAQGLKRIVESGKAQPTTWTFTSREVNNDQAQLQGAVAMQGGEGTVTLDLLKVGSDWKVSAFNLTPK